jgi:hypothetical protein
METKKQKIRTKKGGMSTTLKVVLGAAILGGAGYLGYTQWQGMQAKKELEGENPTKARVTNTDILRKGVKSEDVRSLQTFLMSKNSALPAGWNDGVFGDKTETELQQKYGVKEITKKQFIELQTKGSFTPSTADTKSAAIAKSVTLPKAEKIYALLFTDTPVVNYVNYNASTNDAKFGDVMSVLKSIGSKEEYDEINQLYKYITLHKMSFTPTWRNENLSKPLQSSLIFSTTQREQIKNAVGRFF